MPKTRKSLGTINPTSAKNRSSFLASRRRKSLLAPGATERGTPTFETNRQKNNAKFATPEPGPEFHSGSLLTVGQRVFNQLSDRGRESAAQFSDGSRPTAPLPTDFFNNDIDKAGPKPLFTQNQIDNPVKIRPPSKSLLSFFAKGQGKGQNIRDVNKELKTNEQAGGGGAPIVLGNDDVILGADGRDTKINVDRQGPVESGFFSTFGILRPSAKTDDLGNVIGLNNATGNTTLDRSYQRLFDKNISIDERAAVMDTIRREQEVLLGNSSAGNLFLSKINQQSSESAGRLKEADDDLFSGFQSQEDQIKAQNQKRIADARANAQSQKDSFLAEAERLKKEFEVSQNAQIKDVEEQYKEQISDALSEEGFDTDRSGENLTRSEMDRARAIETKLIKERDDEIAAIRTGFRADINKVDSDAFNSITKANEDVFSLEDGIRQAEITNMQNEQSAESAFGRDVRGAEATAKINLASFKSEELYKAALEQEFAKQGLTTKEVVNALKTVSQTTSPEAFMAQMQALSDDLTGIGIDFNAQELLMSSGLEGRTLAQELANKATEALTASREASTNKGSEVSGFDSANASKYTDEELLTGVDEDGEKLGITSKQREDALNLKKKLGISDPAKESGGFDFFGSAASIFRDIFTDPEAAAGNDNSGFSQEEQDIINSQ